MDLMNIDFRWIWWSNLPYNPEERENTRPTKPHKKGRNLRESSVHSLEQHEQLTTLFSTQGTLWASPKALREKRRSPWGAKTEITMKLVSIPSLRRLRSFNLGLCVLGGINQESLNQPGAQCESRNFDRTTLRSHFCCKPRNINKEESKQILFGDHPSIGYQSLQRPVWLQMASRWFFVEWLLDPLGSIRYIVYNYALQDVGHSMTLGLHCFWIDLYYITLHLGSCILQNLDTKRQLQGLFCFVIVCDTSKQDHVTTIKQHQSKNSLPFIEISREKDQDLR